MPLAFLAMGDDAAGGVEMLALSGRHEGVLVAAATPPAITANSGW